jgi:hypothetical protein
MLSRSSLCDDAFLPQSLRDENLSKGVVDFMRAGMEQIFSL